MCHNDDYNKGIAKNKGVHGNENYCGRLFRYIKYFLDKGGFESIDITQYLPDSLKKYADYGQIQLIPGKHETDGFFIAAMRKKG